PRPAARAASRRARRGRSRTGAATRTVRSRRRKVACLKTKRAREAGPPFSATADARGARSHPEGLAAAAAVLLARVLELEAFVQPLANEVEAGAVDVRQALRVDDDLDAVVLEDVVLRRELVGVFELVGQARAAGRLHAQTHADAPASLAEVAGDVPRRGFGEGDGHLSRRPRRRRARRRGASTCSR